MPVLGTDASNRVASSEGPVMSPPELGGVSPLDHAHDQNDADGRPARSETQAELIAPGRSPVGLIISALAVLWLGYVIITGGSEAGDVGDDGDVGEAGGTPSTTEPTSPDPTIDAMPFEPRIEGALRDGSPFEGLRTIAGRALRRLS